MQHEGDPRRRRALAREGREGGDRDGRRNTTVRPAPGRREARGVREWRAGGLGLGRLRRGRRLRARHRSPAERSAETAQLRDRGRGSLERRPPLRRRDRRLRRASRGMSVTERLLEAIKRDERAVVFTVIEGEPLGAKALAPENG